MISETNFTSRFRGFINVLLVAILLGTANSAFGSTLLQQADSAYNAQNFRQALSLYNTVLDRKGASTELYYNIGNANYRLGNYGKAIVAYERALRLDPSNADARANLEFVNSMLKGLPEDGSSFLSNVHRNITSFASADGWSIVAFILFVAVLCCAAIYIFGTHTTLRKIGFFGGLAVLVLFIYSFIIAWQTADAPERKDIGIVVADNSRLTSNPGTAKNKNEKTIAIPEGSKVEIIDSLSTPNDPVASMWYQVLLNNNTQAWIDSGCIEKI